MFSNPSAITFIGYLILMVLVGFYAWHHTRSFGDYILGGRRLGGLVTALSVGASDMSGWLLMGLPGAVFLSGISESWIGIGLVIGAWLNWKIDAARLRLYTEVSHNALTIPDYFRQRFEDKSNGLALCAAAIILIFFTIYCASGMVAGARLFESTFHMDYSAALWIGAAATIAYVFLGGFLAVSWTDSIQAGERHDRLHQSRHDQHDERTDLHRRHLAACLGARLLRTAAHPRALHGDPLDQGDPERAAHLHALDDLLPRGNLRLRLLRRSLLREPPGARRRRERES